MTPLSDSDNSKVDGDTTLMDFQDDSDFAENEEKHLDNIINVNQKMLENALDGAGFAQFQNILKLADDTFDAEDEYDPTKEAFE